MNPLSFLFPLILSLKPNLAKINKAKLKEHVRGINNVLLKSNDATWDDSFEDRLGDITDAAIDNALGDDQEPIPMGASSVDAGKIFEIAKAKGISTTIVSLLLQFGIPFALARLKKWFPDLAI